jgi:hypothetical protein
MLQWEQKNKKKKENRLCIECLLSGNNIYLFTLSGILPAFGGLVSCLAPCSVELFAVIDYCFAQSAMNMTFDFTHFAGPYESRHINGCDVIQTPPKCEG